MGYLHYTDIEIPMDDRALLHVQIAIAEKLRRGEGFYLSWIELSMGRCSAWIGPGIPLGFSYTHTHHTTINRAWIAEMLQEQHATMGVFVTVEPQPARRT